MVLKKRVYSSTKKIFIYGSGSFVAFFLLLLGLYMYGIEVTTTGDIKCENECVSYFNITLKDYAVCFGSTFTGIATTPNVKTELFKADSRYRADNPARWKAYNFTANKCLERNKTHEFKLIGYKQPKQIVKWGLTLQGKDVDPYWYGVSVTEINLFSSSHTGKYKVLLQTGNESLFDVKLNHNKISQNTSICVRADFLRREIIEADDETRETGRYNYTVPTKFPFYRNTLLTASRNLDVQLVKAPTNIKPTFEVGDILQFCYEADPTIDFYLKFGDESIIIIQESEVSADALLTNMTVELNFTHLNISSDPPYNNLLGYWNFDDSLQGVTDGINTVYDLSGNDFDGTTVGGPNLSVSCLFDNCLSFDGDNEYVDAGNLFDDPVNFSVCVWAYHNARTSDECLVSKSVGTNDGWLLFRDDADGANENLTDTYAFTYFDSGSTSSVRLSATNGSAVEGNWNHVCATMQNETADIVSLYVNGILENTNASASFSGYNTSNSMLFGIIDGLTFDLNGSLDEIMLFNVTLTGAQVLDIYLNQSSRFVDEGYEELYNQSYLGINFKNSKINVSTQFESNFGSTINLSVGYHDTYGDWIDIAPQTLITSGNNYTFNIGYSTTNLTLNYTLSAGNNTNFFYTPIIKGNIAYEVWDNGENIPPDINFTDPTPASGSTQSNTDIYINVSANDTDNGDYISTFIDFNSSLIGWWRMDDADGTNVFDNSSQGKNGINWSSSQTEGYLGKGWSFPSGSNISFSSPVMPVGTNVVSYGGYIYWDDAGVEDAAEYVMHQADDSFAGYQMYNTNVFVICYDGAEIAQAPISSDSWYHVFCVHNETDNMIYLNGLEINRTMSSAVTTNNNFVIGTFNGTLYNFSGKIDDVMVFNRTLTSQEVASLYANSSKTELEVNFTDLAVSGHTFVAYTQDLAGLINTTESRTITISTAGDTTPPDINFTEVIVSTNSIWVNLTAEDTESNISTFIDFNNDTLLWLRMDDLNESGDPYDNSTYNNSCALVSGTQIDGKLGKAMEFKNFVQTGEGDNIDCKNDEIFNMSGNNFTISGWFNFTGYDGAFAQSGVRKEGTFILPYIYPDASVFRFYVDSNGAWQFVTATTTPTQLLGDWHHIVGRWNGTAISIFVDGILENSTEVGGIPMGSITSLFIGRETLTPVYMNGSVDDILIFNRSLSNAEVSALYTNKMKDFLEVDFLNLAPDNYTYVGYSQDTMGLVNFTDTQNVTVTGEAAICNITDVVVSVWAWREKFVDGFSDEYCTKIPINNSFGLEIWSYANGKFISGVGTPSPLPSVDIADNCNLTDIAISMWCYSGAKEINGIDTSTHPYIPVNSTIGEYVWGWIEERKYVNRIVGLIYPII